MCILEISRQVAYTLCQHSVALNNMTKENIATIIRLKHFAVLSHDCGTCLLHYFLYIHTYICVCVCVCVCGYKIHTKIKGAYGVIVMIIRNELSEPSSTPE